MHIHYFQHDHFEDLGYIGDWAKENNHTTSVTRLDFNEPLPAMHDYDWLVILGGKMSVNDANELPWLMEEIQFIKHAIESKKIVIGICLGAQLIAKALGADIIKNSKPEMGFWPIHFTASAKIDDVFSLFPEALTVMHMHFDTFELPAGATNMADSKITHCQAFRYGENVFAFQFHFEITVKDAALFIQETETELVAGEFTQSTETMLELSEHCSINNQYFGKILNQIAKL